MPSRSELEIKSRLFLGLGLLSLVVILLLRMLLPLLLLVGLGAGGFWLWQQYRKKQQHRQRQQSRINAQFYQLLQQQQGRISVLDFAMRTQLDGAAAQEYLNLQAQAFSAFFETTPQGDLIYVFSSAAGGSHPYPTQTKASWGYADQPREHHMRTERAQVEKAHAAWNNAKQIRILRKLAQNEQLDELRLRAGHELAQPERAEKRHPQGAISPKGFISIDLKADAAGYGAVKAEGASHANDASRVSGSHRSPVQKTTHPKTTHKSAIKLPKESGCPETKTGLGKTGSAPINQPLNQPIIYPANQTLPDNLEQSPVVRGRAYSATDRVITIDVTAVRS